MFILVSILHLHLTTHHTNIGVHILAIMDLGTTTVHP
jgi:hypothetical protein